MRRLRETPLNDTVVQVLNVPHGTVHLYLRGAFNPKEPKTICGRFAPGLPKEPAKTAQFATDSGKWTGDNCMFAFCERCFGDAYPVERVLSGEAAVESSEAEDSSSESSS